MATKRGPNYPSMSLPEAISRARKLYDQDGRAQTSPAVAVGAWGYSSLNGASLRVMSALRQYGLLESAEDYVRLTDRALAILLEPDGSHDKIKAIREAARAPGIFAALAEEYREALPSDGAIVAYLVRRQGYGEDAAQKVVAAFRENSHFIAELGDTQETPEAQTESLEAPVIAGLEQNAPGRRTASPNREGILQQSWILAHDLVASVGFTRMPSEQEIGVLKQYLDIAAKVLQVQSKQPPSESGKEGAQVG